MRVTYGPSAEPGPSSPAQAKDRTAPAPLPWDDPESRPLEDVREAMRQAEEDYGRRLAGHRVPVGVMTHDVAESESQPGVFYDLELGGDGRWRCSCKGFTYTGDCKHAQRKAGGRSW